MKKSIIIIAVVAAMFTGCRTSQKSLADIRSEVSWTAFCNAHGYDISNNTFDVINEYLDTWCGSVDEETAFINAGVQPY